MSIQNSRGWRYRIQRNCDEDSRVEKFREALNERLTTDPPNRSIAVARTAFLRCQFRRHGTTDKNPNAQAPHALPKFPGSDCDPAQNAPQHRSLPRYHPQTDAQTVASETSGAIRTPQYLNVPSLLASKSESPSYGAVQDQCLGCQGEPPTQVSIKSSGDKIGTAFSSVSCFSRQGLLSS